MKQVIYVIKQKAEYLKFENQLPSNMKGAGIKTFINSKIRKGKLLANPKKDARDHDNITLIF